jgi:hypothetical protein
MSMSVYTGLNLFNFIRKHFLQICVWKGTVHLQKVLDMMSTSIYTGLNPFNFIRKHFLQICLWDVSYVSSYCSLYLIKGAWAITIHWQLNLCTVMYWIYLLPSTQQIIGYNGFTTTCFDSHESSSGYVKNLLVLAVLLLTVSCSGRCWSVWSGGWPYTDMNENLKTYIKKCY